jgi:hypothetical protein
VGPKLANHKRGRVGESDERETPDELFAEKHAKYRFTLDAAAAHDNHKLPRYYTKEGLYVADAAGTHCVDFATSGLAGSWQDEYVWCNPPYSDIAPWVVKAWTSGAHLVYMLVPNWTDRKWWLDLIEPYRDGKGWDQGLPMDLTTEFLGRHRFLYKGQPIRTEDGKIGQPEFGLVGLIWTRKG